MIINDCWSFKRSVVTGRTKRQEWVCKSCGKEVDVVIKNDSDYARGNELIDECSCLKNKESTFN